MSSQQSSDIRQRTADVRFYCLESRAASRLVYQNSRKIISCNISCLCAVSFFTKSIWSGDFRKPDKTEEEETQDPCPYCSNEVPQTKLDCPECKNTIPYCIITVS